MLNLAKRFIESPEDTGRKIGGPLWRHMLRGEPCTYCGRAAGRGKKSRKSRTLDHIQPRASGGRNGWENETPACMGCNMRKGDSSALLFLVRRGGYGEVRTDGYAEAR